MPYLWLALAVLVIASYFDIKTRSLPKALTYPALAIGLALHAYESVSISSIDPFFLSVMTALACFFFAFTIYKLGAWAGGDVKLFTALGAILPVYAGIYFFPFIILAASFLAVLPFAIAYVSYHFITTPKLRRSVAKDFRKWLERAFYSPFYAIAAYFGISWLGIHWIAALPVIAVFYKAQRYALVPVALLSITAFCTDFFSYAYYFCYLIMFSAVLFLGVASFKTARKHLLRYKTTRLEEGMIPAEDIVVKGVKLADSRKARGLTRDEIRALRKAGVKEIVVKKSMPFVPLLAIGLVIAVILREIFI